jgi:hypothetical protein
MLEDPKARDGIEAGTGERKTSKVCLRTLERARESSERCARYIDSKNVKTRSLEWYEVSAGSAPNIED